MTDRVRDSYDAMAEQYAALIFGDGLDWTPLDGEQLDRFADMVASRSGVVVDLGCGPGHVVSYLDKLGVAAIGYDISAGQIAQACRAFPDLRFEIADLTTLDLAAPGLTGSPIRGMVARYSLIHMPPIRLAGIFAGWIPLLEPGAPVLVSFFAAATAESHGTPFDHAVATAFELFPETIVRQLQTAGLDEVDVVIRSPRRGERPLDHATVLAQRPLT